MSLLQTGRQVVANTTDAAGRAASTATESTAAAGRRVRAVFAFAEARLDAVGGTRIPKLPVGGRTATVALAAASIAGVAVVGFDVELPWAAGLFAGIVAGDILVKAVVLAAAGVAGLLAWGQTQAAETADRTRNVVTATASAGVATGLAVVFGVVDPVAMAVGLFGDVLVTGAVGGFAAITALVGAASGRVMGASRRGAAAAGAVGAVSGGLVAAASVPALAGAGLVGLTAITDNLIPVSVFAAAIVFFVTDSLANIGEFSASLAFALRIGTVVAFSIVVASEVFGLPVPFLLLGGGLGA